MWTGEHFDCEKWGAVHKNVLQKLKMWTERNRTEQQSRTGGTAKQNRTTAPNGTAEQNRAEQNRTAKQNRWNSRAEQNNSTKRNSKVYRKSYRLLPPMKLLRSEVAGTSLSETGVK